MVWYNTGRRYVKERILQIMEGYIDFSDCRIDDRKYYGGANGKKVCVIYNRQPYMLKTSVLKDGEYTNTSVCEYLGSHIFRS